MSTSTELMTTCAFASLLESFGLQIPDNTTSIKLSVLVDHYPSMLFTVSRIGDRSITKKGQRLKIEGLTERDVNSKVLAWLGLSEEEIKDTCEVEVLATMDGIAMITVKKALSVNKDGWKKIVEVICES